MIYKGHEICNENLSYSIAQREVEYCVEHNGVQQWLVVVRPVEPAWGRVVQTVLIGELPSPQSVRVRQRGVNQRRLSIALKTGDINHLRAMVFAPEDRIGNVVKLIIKLRTEIDGLIAGRVRELDGSPERGNTDLAIRIARKQIDKILADSTLCPGRCQCESEDSVEKPK